MDGRAFLDVARLLMTTPTEANRRSAVGRAYYAMLNEARAALERWGFLMPAGATIDDDNVSAYIMVPNMDLLRVVDSVTQLKQNRRIGDNAITGSGVFADDKEAKRLLLLAEIGIDLLDQIEADPTRLEKAIADIRAGRP